MTMSIRAYARHRGVSHVTVIHAVKAGRIPAEPDGSIDPVKADAAWIANTNPARQRDTTPAAPAAKAVPRPEPAAVPRMKPVPEAAIGSVRQTLQDNGEPIPAAGQMTYLKARTANEVLRAQTGSLRLQKMKGEMIDRARATALVFKLARQERDAWLNWPSRISAEMAAEMGVDANTLHSVMERRVRQHLSELSEIRPTFR